MRRLTTERHKVTNPHNHMHTNPIGIEKSIYTLYRVNGCVRVLLSTVFLSSNFASLRSSSSFSSRRLFSYLSFVAVALAICPRAIVSLDRERRRRRRQNEQVRQINTHTKTHQTTPSDWSKPVCERTVGERDAGRALGV